VLFSSDFQLIAEIITSYLNRLNYFEIFTNFIVLKIFALRAVLALSVVNVRETMRDKEGCP